MIRFVRKCFPRCILGKAKQIVGDNTNFYFQKYLEPYKTKTVLLAILKLHVFLFFKRLASLRFLQYHWSVRLGTREQTHYMVHTVLINSNG